VNPEVGAAVEALVEEGVLTPEQALIPRRAARGELISVRFELRTLLWLGVSLVVAGVGLLVKQNLDRIGPLAIAIALGVAAAGCLAWVARVAPPFRWDEQASPSLAFDYILLLGATLVGADLAFIEIKFTALGAGWPWHLLFSSLLYAALAMRFDSRVVLSLALSTFAAWRGVAMGSLASAPFGRWQPGLVRANAIACGALFVVAGWALVRLRRKAHFEPTAAHMGWLLVLGSMGFGMVDRLGDPWWVAWAVALALTGAALAWGAALARRFWLFAMGVLGVYAAISRFVVDAVPDGTTRSLWFLVTSVAVIVLLIGSQRRLAEGP
jgi:hypothetical protein